MELRILTITNRSRLCYTLMRIFILLIISSTLAESATFFYGASRDKVVPKKPENGLDAAEYQVVLDFCRMLRHLNGFENKVRNWHKKVQKSREVCARLLNVLQPIVKNGEIVV